MQVQTRKHIYTPEEYLELEEKAASNSNLDQIIIRTKIIDEKWIQIAIADNGNGIPENVKNRIFNPFFTTKEISKGTDMGIAISYRIITEKHHGKLECFSDIGKGTEFIIQIPVKQAANNTAYSD
ncbi:sensor histidine kinase [Aphanizomenon sp. CS-733/32]|uniref:sensor histidine kinase n=1 Tax=Aphanizomenon sp. CS-733/32 TaxID=3021715 RepID=UPI002FEDEBC0